MLVLFTNLGLTEFQVRYLALFLLFSVIGGFGWFWMRNLHKNIHRVSTPSRKVREFVRGSGEVREIRDFLGKVREKNFYPCNFLTSIKKSIAHRYVCSWIVYDNQFYIWCYHLHVVLRWFNIVNPFYFNLREVVFHLNRGKTLHAINCVAFFAKAFISSLNTEL